MLAGSDSSLAVIIQRKHGFCMREKEKIHIIPRESWQSVQLYWFLTSLWTVGEDKNEVHIWYTWIPEAEKPACVPRHCMIPLWFWSGRRSALRHPCSDLESHLKLQLLLKACVLPFQTELAWLQLTAIHPEVELRMFLLAKARWEQLWALGRVIPTASSTARGTQLPDFCSHMVWAQWMSPCPKALTAIPPAHTFNHCPLCWLWSFQSCQAQLWLKKYTKFTKILWHISHNDFPVKTFRYMGQWSLGRFLVYMVLNQGQDLLFMD